MQLDCPDATWYLPTSHLSHDADELEGCAVPPSHAAQLLWPVSSLYLPASHTEHSPAPDPLYLPASHDRHAVAFGEEYVPASQSEQLDSPDALILPPSHDSQLVCPVAPWYRPASHASHDVDELERCAKPPSQSEQLL